MSELRLEFQKEMVCLSNSGYALTKFTQNNTLLHGAVIEAARMQLSLLGLRCKLICYIEDVRRTGNLQQKQRGVSVSAGLSWQKTTFPSLPASRQQ